MNVARWESSMATSSRQTRASGSARDDDVVERHVADLVDRPAVAQDHAFEGHPLVDLVLAGLDADEDGIEIAGLGLREEPDLAEVDAQDRDVDLGDGPDRAQERAVAAEDDQGVGRAAAREAARRCRRTGPANDRCRGSGTSPRPAR